VAVTSAAEFLAPTTATWRRWRWISSRRLHGLGGGTRPRATPTRCGKRPPRGGVAAVRHGVGRAGRVAGRTADDLFDEALAVVGGERWAFDHARIQLAYGEHLRRCRETGPARRHLGGALATFQRLSAEPWTV
jgi:hypothetical protein